MTHFVSQLFIFHGRDKVQALTRAFLFNHLTISSFVNAGFRPKVAISIKSGHKLADSAEVNVRVWMCFVCVVG